MSTCNRLDLQTLGSQPIMPKNLPDQWCEVALRITRERERLSQLELGSPPLLVRPCNWPYWQVYSTL